MKKFEYKIVIGNVVEKIFQDQSPLGNDGDEVRLNELGEDGWELVSVIYPVKPKNEGIGARAALYYLKRELQN